MNNKYIDPVVRITEIQSVINNSTIPGMRKDEGITPLQIADIMEVDVDVILNDITNILRFNFLKVTTPSNLSNGEVLDASELCEDTVLILSDIPLNYAIAMDQKDEAEFFRFYVKNSINYDYKLQRGQFIVQDSLKMIDDYKQNIITAIYDFLCDELTISFTYETEKDKFETRTIKPLTVLVDKFNSKYNLITIENGELSFYDVDKIKSIPRVSAPIEIDDLSPLDVIPYLWGTDPHEKKVHVKILINDPTNAKNLMRKVLSELEVHSEGTITYDEKNTYYEDDVIGINEFKSWVASYGANILVLEPTDLADEIIDSAKKTLRQYKVHNPDIIID